MKSEGSRASQWGKLRARGRRTLGYDVGLQFDSHRSREAAVDEGQLQREREHLRALLELTNAVTTRDVASLAASIAPTANRRP
jgi:hypothetical protein